MKKVSKSEVEAQRVSEIVERKKVVLSNLKLLRNHLFSIAYDGIINKKGAMEVKSALLRAFRLNRWGRYRDQSLVDCAFNYYLSNFGQNETFLMANIEKDMSLKLANKVNNKVGRDFEHFKKEKMINEQINDARKSKSPLFLCSYHSHPAKDHKDYQAKMYIDKEWRSYVVGRKATRSLSKYVKTNNVATIQDITTKKPYLIYRPYCKHYFVSIPTDVAISNGGKDATSSLLHKYGAIRDEHNTTRADYERRRLLEEIKLLEALPKSQEVAQKIRQLRAKYVARYPR